MPFGYYYDPTMLILVPAIIISLVAQYLVNSSYTKYSRVGIMNGYTGAEVARRMLDEAGLYNVPIEIVNRKLGDHYDPRSRVLRLSPAVYNDRTISSACIAAHEVGHAIQHSQSYGPLQLRNSVAGVVNYASSISWILFLVGLVMSAKPLLTIGILLFTVAVFFQLITLPVEFNASSRALKILKSKGYLMESEISGAKKVLSAAALTYVAAAIMSILQLLRLIALSNRRD